MNKKYIYGIYQIENDLTHSIRFTEKLKDAVAFVLKNYDKEGFEPPYDEENEWDCYEIEIYRHALDDFPGTTEVIRFVFTLKHPNKDQVPKWIARIEDYLEPESGKLRKWLFNKNKSSSATVYLQKAGVFSSEDICVCLDAGYMYTAETFEELFDLVTSEYKHDKHMIG